MCWKLQTNLFFRSFGWFLPFGIEEDEKEASEHKDSHEGERSMFLHSLGGFYHLKTLYLLKIKPMASYSLSDSAPSMLLAVLVHHELWTLFCACLFKFELDFKNVDKWMEIWNKNLGFSRSNMKYIVRLNRRVWM